MRLLFSLAGTRTCIVFCCILFLSSFDLTAQEVISGTVRDEKNQEPIRAAVIRIHDSFIQTTSDEQGNFSFRRLNRQSVELEINHLSYEPKLLPVKLPATGLTILLTSKIYLSDEVTITAVRASNNSAVAFTNVSKQELSVRNLGQDLPYLLNLSPSVVLSSDAGAGVGYTGIRIRGSDGTRINVTLNGIPVNDAESHQVYWVDLPDLASSVENIQVQRGLGTSTNGTGAFGGSVNILSNQLSSSPYGSINSSVGSFQTSKNTISFGSGIVGKRFAMEGRLSNISSKGYIDRAVSDLRSFYFSGGYYGSKSSLRAIIHSGKEKTYQAWYGVPEELLVSNRTYNPAGAYVDANGQEQFYENQTDNYRQDYYTLLFSHQVSTSWNLSTAFHYTKGKGYYEEYAAGDYFSTYALPEIFRPSDTLYTSDFIRQRWLDNDFYGFTWSLNYDHRKLEIHTGGAGNRYSGDHFGELLWSKDQPINPYPLRYYADHARKDDFTIYSKLNYQFIPKVNGFVDVQFRAVNYAFRGFNESGASVPKSESLHFFNPKAGLTVHLSSRQMIYGSVGLGHKEPVRDDYIHASPLLPKPESLLDLEAGYKFNGRLISAGINFYYMHYKDQLILTGKINDVGEYVRQNVPSSYRSGIEMDMMYKLGKRWSFNANVTVSRDRIDAYTENLYDDKDYTLYIIAYSNTHIAFSPEVIGSGILHWEPIRSCSIELSGKYVGKQYLDNTTSELKKTNPYLINDLLIHCSVTPQWIHEIGLTVMLNNIFNRKYESNGATYNSISNGQIAMYNYYFPQAGFNWMAGVSVNFK